MDRNRSVFVRNARPVMRFVRPNDNRRYNTSMNRSFGNINENGSYNMEEEDETLDDDLFRSIVESMYSDGAYGRSQYAFKAQRAGDNYAVRSVLRGTEEWSNVLSPFVSDLAFCSISNKKTTISFQPYTCQAAVLFVDLSGYSKITSSLAHKGAHVLSNAVNAYLSRLLTIIKESGGDVIKFAGDAILVVWDGNEQELEINVLCAARCAVQLQEKAGVHPVQGTPHSFRIHCGLCCGPLDSEIFEAAVANNTQRLFHYVGGDAMAEIGDLVDLAKAGETAVSRNCYNFLELGAFDDIPGHEQAMLLRSLSLDDVELVELMDWHINKKAEQRRAVRANMVLEEEFIHSKVLDYLTHGGTSPTQIAQMRNLCVLFIAMTSQGSSTNWLLEVQSILDKNRCPMVQIIHDDKGVHVVAAVNLYEAVPECSLVGLEVCRELRRQRVGTAVGMALGQTFCGVTGSNDIACRWDITGHAVVRAARLMQYALQQYVEFAIDHSLYEDPMAATRMTELDTSVTLKGTAAPIPVYTLSDAELFSAFRILDNTHGSIYNDKVQEIQNHINHRQRSAVLLSGIPMSGMKIVCQRAAGFSDLVPYWHLCEVSAGFLQLAETISTWFHYHPRLRRQATSVQEDLKASRWSCAHDQCVQLVDDALQLGYSACFVVDRIQDLDRFSLSLIRECLQNNQTRRRNDAMPARAPNPPSRIVRRASSEESQFDSLKGQICFLCTHLPLYGAKTGEDIVHEIVRSHTSFKIPIIEIGEASKPEFKALVRDLFDLEVEDRWLDAYVESSGYCAEYFLERTEAVRNQSAELWKEGREAMVEISDELVMFIPPNLMRKNKNMKVTEIRAEIAMRFAQVYDEIPPLCQMILKIVTIATMRGFYKIPQRILAEAMDQLIQPNVEREELDVLLEELVDVCVLKVEDKDERTFIAGTDDGNGDMSRVLTVQSPALSDIVMDVCTPVQIQSIASVLIDLLQNLTRNNFRVSLVVASLHLLLDHELSTVQRVWREAFRTFLQQSRHWPEQLINGWKEIIDDEIRDAGFNSREVLGDGFSVFLPPQRRISSFLAMLKMYSAPISLGPMGLTLSVICRNTVHEYGIFNGALSSVASDRLRGATSSACGRYMMELTVVENYLRDMGAGGSWDEVEAEMEMISFVANPAECCDSVETKAMLLLSEIIPRFIEHRLQRLHHLVTALKGTGDIPDVVKASRDQCVRRAYEALQADKSRMDAAQDALMILATMNWKPLSVPEFLPLTHQQSITNIRNRTLKRLSDVEALMFRHQQSVDDLEAFLLVTSIIKNAQKDGMC